MSGLLRNMPTGCVRKEPDERQKHQTPALNPCAVSVCRLQRHDYSTRLQLSQRWPSFFTSRHRPPWPSPYHRQVRTTPRVYSACPITPASSYSCVLELNCWVCLPASPSLSSSSFWESIVVVTPTQPFPCTSLITQTCTALPRLAYGNASRIYMYMYCTVTLDPGCLAPQIADPPSCTPCEKEYIYTSCLHLYMATCHRPEPTFKRSRPISRIPPRSPFSLSPGSVHGIREGAQFLSASSFV
ncbi:hypothetical protein J3F83DRAFT_595583 [Trichoderma novae-zelandiae]